VAGEFVLEFKHPTRVPPTSAEQVPQVFNPFVEAY
jgi:hypothetical protein